MSLVIGRTDGFERRYVQKFRNLISDFGEFINYEYDRAAVDLGLHLTEPSSESGGLETVSNVRIWFQLKGVQSSTLSLIDFERSADIAIPLKVSHIKFWYASPEAIYVAVYIECIDTFIAEDIRNIVDRTWKDDILNPLTLGSQEKITVKLSKAAILDQVRLKDMTKHRSLRIDGPSFRGRPLGHRLDPLRCILKKMEPTIFSSLVERLLEEHRYQVEEEVDIKNLFPQNSDDIARLTYGTLHYTYEWVFQMTTLFTPDNSGFRLEGSPISAQGKCAVLIHSKKCNRPQSKVLKQLIKQMNEKEIEHLLVFVNEQITRDMAYAGSFVSILRKKDVKCVPQGLSELAFSLLVATLVYIDFRDKVSFELVNYWF